MLRRVVKYFNLEPTGAAGMNGVRKNEDFGSQSESVDVTRLRKRYHDIEIHIIPASITMLRAVPDKKQARYIPPFYYARGTRLLFVCTRYIRNQ